MLKKAHAKCHTTVSTMCDTRVTPYFHDKLRELCSCERTKILLYFYSCCVHDKLW